MILLLSVRTNTKFNHLHYLGIIKNKLKQYINEQNITLQTFFNLMDTNSDGQITLAEFKQKIKMLTSILDDGEINTLFQAIDR